MFRHFFLDKIELVKNISLRRKTVFLRWCHHKAVSQVKKWRIWCAEYSQNILDKWRYELSLTFRFQKILKCLAVTQHYFIILSVSDYHKNMIFLSQKKNRHSHWQQNTHTNWQKIKSNCHYKPTIKKIKLSLTMKW